MFKKLNIGNRLYLSAAIIFFTFAFGIYTYNNSLKETDLSYRNLMDKEISLAARTQKISALFEKCERYEELFLRVRSEEILNAQQNTLEKINSIVTEISKSSERSTELNKIKDQLIKHKESFYRIVNSWKTKGFNQEDSDGLQYKFSGIAEKLINDVKKHQLEALYIKFMAVRIAEKDFIFKKEVMYKTRLDMAIVEFGYEIANLDVSDKTKNMYVASLNEYKKVYKAMQPISQEKRLERYSSLADISVKIENQIAKLYVPQVKTLILNVRQDEKKYLLEGRKSQLSLEEILASHNVEEEKPEKQAGNSGGGGDLLGGLFAEEEAQKEAPKKARSEMDNFEQTLDSLEKLEKGFKDLEDNISEEDINKAVSSIQNYKDNFSLLVKEDDAINLEMVSLSESSKNLHKAVEDIVILTNKSVQEKRGLINSDIKSSSKKALFASAASVMIGFLLFFGITKTITKPIGNAVNFAEAIANKKLDKELIIDSKDEVAFLANSLNRASENLNSSFKDINGKTTLLNESSHILSDTSVKFSQSFEEVDINAEKSSEATKQMTENLESVKKNSQKLKEGSDDVLENIQKVSKNIVSVSEAVSSSEMNISSISAATEQMSATIGEIAENGERSRSITEEAFTMTDQAYEQVTELIKAAREIEEIVNLIVEISEQTKNLSLNATIEAARAGEAGKGFAVVANEVKSLATQTNEASEKIRGSIQQITDISQGTTTQMNSVKSIVSQIKDNSNLVASAIEEQNITVKDNAENIASAAAGLIQITKAMDESKELVKNTVLDVHEMVNIVGSVNESCLQSVDENKLIVSSISNIGQSVSKCKGDAGQLNETSKSLDSMAKGLKELVGEFKLKA